MLHLFLIVGGSGKEASTIVADAALPSPPSFFLVTALVQVVSRL